MKILTRKASEPVESARESARGGKKTRQKGALYTLDGVPALNVEGRGPFNDSALSFLSSFLSLLRLFATPDPFCQHLPDRPDQMPKHRPVQTRSSVDNPVISSMLSAPRTHDHLSSFDNSFTFFFFLRSFRNLETVQLRTLKRCFILLGYNDCTD